FFLGSGGHANGSRGDGTLEPQPPACVERADQFADDPELPFVAAMSHAGNYRLDLRERARSSDTLVYRTRPLEHPLTILREPEAGLLTSADCPDADLAGWIAEERPDGSLVELTYGHLRLRYREGFDREVLLQPGTVVEARIRFHYVGHRLPPGCA